MRGLDADRLAGHQQAPGRVAPDARSRRGRDRRDRVPAERRRPEPRPAALADARRRSSPGCATSGSPRRSTGSPRSPRRPGYGVLLEEIESTDTVDIAPVIEFLIAHRVEGIIFAAPQLGTNIATVRAQLPAASPADRLPEVGDRRPRSRRSSSTTTAVPDMATHAPAGAWSPTDRPPGRPAALARGAGSSRRLARRAARGRRRARSGGAPATGRAASGETGFERAAGARPRPRRPLRRPMTRWRSASCTRRTAAGSPSRTTSPWSASTVSTRAAHFTPSLTTVVQPLRELGELAVREVLGDRQRGAWARRRFAA